LIKTVQAVQVVQIVQAVSQILNPNIEIQNKLKDLNSNYEIRNGFVWNFPIFGHLKLFRISDFEFRICNLVYTWRPLRLCAKNLPSCPSCLRGENYFLLFGCGFAALSSLRLNLS